MLEDDKAPSEAQARQTAAGQYMALSAALHALIGSHPNPTAFSKLFDQYAEISSQILLTKTALQADDGLRQAYAETLRSIRSVIPTS